MKVVIGHVMEWNRECFKIKSHDNEEVFHVVPVPPVRTLDALIVVSKQSQVLAIHNVSTGREILYRPIGPYKKTSENWNKDMMALGVILLLVLSFVCHVSKSAHLLNQYGTNVVLVIIGLIALRLIWCFYRSSNAAIRWNERLDYEVQKAIIGKICDPYIYEECKHE